MLQKCRAYDFSIAAELSRHDLTVLWQLPPQADLRKYISDDLLDFTEPPDTHVLESATPSNAWNQKRQDARISVRTISSAVRGWNYHSRINARDPAGACDSDAIRDGSLGLGPDV